MNKNNLSRRDLMRVGALGLGGALFAPARRSKALPVTVGNPSDETPLPPGTQRVNPFDGSYSPVITPNGASLPWRMVGATKVYHLIVEEVEHTFAPGLTTTCWGYNGRVHGPTIEAVEGDHVRIYVTNRLPAAATTVHWHGLFLPNGMDGVGGLNQRAIRPGETFKYEFTLRQSGTFMSHSHHDEMTQMAMGMMGMIVIHPRHDPNPVDRDFAPDLAPVIGGAVADEHLAPLVPARPLLACVKLARQLHADGVLDLHFVLACRGRRVPLFPEELDPLDSFLITLQRKKLTLLLWVHQILQP